MPGMLLGYSFEPRPNGRALATTGSVMTIGSSINGCSHAKKNNLTRENKIECRSLKGLTWFKRSFLSSSSIKKPKGGSRRVVLTKK